MSCRPVVVIALIALAASVANLAPSAAQAASPAEGKVTLYNDVTLEFPNPRPQGIPKDPVTPPYLVNPPAVIPIDVGRQLFVDDFLIADTTLSRLYHLPQYYEANPVLKPEKPWELEGRGPMTLPVSVVWDAKDQLFKMWYSAGYNKYMAYATSKDGIYWDRPNLDVRPGTNIVANFSASTVWLDHDEQDPAKRFKIFSSKSGNAVVQGSWGLGVHFSPDGIHWTKEPIKSGSVGDATTAFYNPFRKVWVYSLRHGWGKPRSRRYFERADLENSPIWAGLDNKYDGTVPWFWLGADSADFPREELQMVPQLYNFNARAYESLMVGYFTIWRGDTRETDQPELPPAGKKLHELGRPKIKEVCLGFSRDGYNFSRPDRRSFLPVSDKMGDWNWGNVQDQAAGPLVVGDKLYFHVGGRAGKSFPCDDADAGGSTGLAIMRRDGFASMDIGGNKEGRLTTRPVTFKGKHLFVNLDAPKGELRAEVLDEAGKPIAPFTKENCQVVTGDKTLATVVWRDAPDLSAVAGKPVRLRFHLKNGRLYSFWMSPDRSGASYGYVAAGGPGYPGPIDTVGEGAVK